MRRVAIRLVVALIAFTLGLALVAVWREVRRPAAQRATDAPCLSQQAHTPIGPVSDASSPNDLPILAYCELVNNPMRYSGQTVRVRARLSFSIHGYFLSDENCDGIESLTAVNFSPQNVTEVERALNEARTKYYRAMWLDVIIAGRFEKVTPPHESDTYWDRFPLHFEIMRVEKAR